MQAAAVTGTVNETAAHLGVDRAAYVRMFSSLVRDADGILPNFLAPLRSIPSSPVATALFGLKGLSSAERLATRFRTVEARAIMAGAAAHSMLPFNAPLSGAFGLLFTMLAHSLGWPVVEGGSARIVDALTRSWSHSTVGSSPANGSGGCMTCPRPGPRSSTSRRAN